MLSSINKCMKMQCKPEAYTPCNLSLLSCATDPRAVSQRAVSGARRRVALRSGRAQRGARPAHRARPGQACLRLLGLQDLGQAALARREDALNYHSLARRKFECAMVAESHRSYWSRCFDVVNHQSTLNIQEF